MTKQEEVDKVLIAYARAVSEVEDRELMTHSMMREEWGILLDKVKHELSDLGIVIKLDRELPDFCEDERKRLEDVPKHWDMRTKLDTWVMQDCLHTIGVTERTKGDMLKWHNDSLKPLIKEE